MAGQADRRRPVAVARWPSPGGRRPVAVAPAARPARRDACARIARPGAVAPGEPVRTFAPPPRRPRAL